jgi:hypothetical protein
VLFLFTYLKISLLYITKDMYGSIKGIARNAMQSVKILELPGADDDLELDL